ncbi:MAG: hypothetical protein WCT08_06235 [Patescibacteria group bacterium]|jgi:hypothetical protein
MRIFLGISVGILLIAAVVLIYPTCFGHSKNLKFAEVVVTGENSGIVRQEVIQVWTERHVKFGEGVDTLFLSAEWVNSPGFAGTGLHGLAVFARSNQFTGVESISLSNFERDQFDDKRAVTFAHAVATKMFQAAINQQ